MNYEAGNDKRAVLHIFSNVLIYSLFPVILVGSKHEADALATLFYSQVVGFFITGLLAKRKSRTEVLEDIRKAPLLLFFMSMASLFIGIFFLWSLEHTSGLTTVIALELWPTFALIFAAFFIKKNWQKFTFLHGVLFAIAASGIVLLSLLEAGSTSKFSGADSSFFSPGVFIALLAAIASGATALQTRLFYTYEETPSFRGGAYTIMLCRFVSIPVTLILVVVFDSNLLTFEAFFWGGLLGMTAYGLASVLAITGLRHSENLLNILLWYMTPLLATIWLIVLYDAQLSDFHIIAFMPIIFANIFSNLNVIRRISFFVVAMFSLCLGVVIYLYGGQGSGEYFRALGVLVSAFAILVSFLLQRKLNDIREITLELNSAMQFVRSEKCDQSNALTYLDARLIGSDPAPSIDGVKLPDKVKNRLDNAFNLIQVERITSFSSVETVVLSTITGTLMILSLWFRDAGFVSDMVAFVVCMSSVFLTAFAIECSTFKFQWRIAQGIVQSGRGTTFDKESILLSILGMSVLVGLILCLLVDKWVYDFFDNPVLRSAYF